MAYATATDTENGFRTFDSDDKAKCEALLEEAAVIIDAYNSGAPEDAKKVVSVRMVRRALGDGGDLSVPMGASQGTVSAMGYSQSWTLSNGSAGELYISKLEKKLLGYGNSIGSYSPVEGLAVASDD